MYTMALDIFKPNLTSTEAGALLDKETRGKVFEDGIYKYRIFVSFADEKSRIANSSIASGIILTILNTPEYIDAGLLRYALARVAIMLQNYKESVKFLINKIWVDSYGHEVNFANMIGASKQIIDLKNPEPDLVTITRFSLDEFNAGGERKFKKLDRFVNYFGEHHSEMSISLEPDSPVFTNIEEADTREEYYTTMKSLIKAGKTEPVKRSNGVPPLKYTVRCYPEKAVSYSTSDGLKIKYDIKVNLFIHGEHPLAKGKLTMDAQKAVETSQSRRSKSMYTGLGNVLIDAMAKPVVNFFDHSPVEVRKTIVSLIIDGGPVGNWATTTYVATD